MNDINNYTGLPEGMTRENANLGAPDIMNVLMAQLENSGGVVMDNILNYTGLPEILPRDKVNLGISDIVNVLMAILATGGGGGGGGAVTSVNTRVGAIELTKADVQLSNVNNTSDQNKPVSNAQATADSNALSTAIQYTTDSIAFERGRANGLAPLNSNSRLPLDNGSLTGVIVPSLSSIAAGDGLQEIANKAEGKLAQLSYAIFLNSKVQNWLSNIVSNGGSISPSQLGAGLFFLNTLNQLGIAANCVYANLCLGNNYQSAVANIIYQGENKYLTGIGRAIGTSDFNPQKGWSVGSGLTNIETNFNVLGYSASAFTTVSGITDNTNYTGGNIFGFNSHGILKTQDRYGFSVAQFSGRGNVQGPFEAMSNIKGDHVLVQGAGVLDWYKDGVLFGTANEATTGTLTSNTLKISANNITYTLAFNTALNSGQVSILQRTLNGLNTLSGRASNKLDISSVVFEGSSITSSYVPPFFEYSPKYISTVIDSIGSIDTDNTQVCQLSLSGQTVVGMYNSAIENRRLLNTNNFNNKKQNVIVIEVGPNDIGNAPYPSADSIYDTYVIPMCRNRIASGYTVLLQTTLNSINYAGYGALGNANANDAMLGLRRLNFRIKSDVNNYNGINAHGVVLFDEIPEALNPNNSTSYQDGLHPTPFLGSTVWAPVTAREIRRAIGRKQTDIGNHQSEIPQYITADIAPTYNGAITSYRQFKNYILSGTFSFTLPDPMLFFGMKLILKNKSGIQTIVGTVEGVVNPTLVTSYATMRIESVKTGINTFEWVTF